MVRKVIVNFYKFCSRLLQMWREAKVTRATSYSLAFYGESVCYIFRDESDDLTVKINTQLHVMQEMRNTLAGINGEANDFMLVSSGCA